MREFHARNYELKKKKPKTNIRKGIYLNTIIFIISIELMDLSIITIATNITKLLTSDFLCFLKEEYITIYEVVIKIRPESD